MKKSKDNLSIIIFMFLIMIVDAICESVRGVFIPILKTDFNINNTTIGRWLLVGSLGYIIFTYFGGIFSKKIGRKKVFLSGFLLAVMACFMFSIANSLVMLFIAVFFINAALALCGIATNTLIPVISVGFQAVLMNLTHFFYGLGATVGTKSAGYLIQRNISWHKIYFGIGIMFIFMIIILVFIKIPEVNIKDDNNKIDYKEVFTNKLVYFYGLALGFYVFAECGIMSWIVNFIQSKYAYGINKATYYASLFTAIFTIGRLFGGFVVEKFGYINTVIKSLVLAVGFLFVGLFMGEQGLIIISLSGLFFAITFPTLILSASKAFGEEASHVIGIIVSCGSIINMILNLIIGGLNDKIGEAKAFYIIPISLVISLVFIYIIKYYTKKQSSKIEACAND